MTNMTQHQSTSKVNMLVLGDSGAGKTGGLASLVDAGLKVRILDFDNGVGPIRGFVKKPELLANVDFLTLRDDYKLIGPKVAATKASAFQRGMQALTDGKEWGNPDIGPLSTWGSDCVLVVDTLSTMSKSSFQMVLIANGRAAGRPEQSDYGTAMDNVENFLNLVTGPDIKCHVLVQTHTTRNEDTGKIYPEALGSKLPPKVAKPFDNMISLSVGPGGKRQYKTKIDGMLALKTAVPLSESYPLETGLADIFRALTGKKELV